MCLSLSISRKEGDKNQNKEQGKKGTRIRQGSNEKRRQEQRGWWQKTSGEDVGVFSVWLHLLLTLRTRLWSSLQQRPSPHHRQLPESKKLVKGFCIVHWLSPWPLHRRSCQERCHSGYHSRHWSSSGLEPGNRFSRIQNQIILQIQRQISLGLFQPHLDVMGYYLPVGKRQESKESSRCSSRHPSTTVRHWLVPGSKAAARWGFVAWAELSTSWAWRHSPPGNHCQLPSLLLLQPGGQLDNRGWCVLLLLSRVGLQTLQFHLWSVTENCGRRQWVRGESLDTANYPIQASQVLPNPIPYHRNGSVMSDRGQWKPHR